MKTHTYLLFVLTLLFIGCLDHKIPKAELDFVNFTALKTQHPLMSVYEINFTSNLPIDSLIGSIGGSPYIFCSLQKDLDFVIKATEIENPNLSGNFKRVDLDSKNKKLFSYSAEVVFYNSYGSKSEYLTDEEIEKLLSNKKCIPCKIVTRFFMDTRKPYLSSPMCIPVEDILKVIEE